MNHSGSVPEEFRGSLFVGVFSTGSGYEVMVMDNVDAYREQRRGMEEHLGWTAVRTYPMVNADFFEKVGKYAGSAEIGSESSDFAVGKILGLGSD